MIYRSKFRQVLSRAAVVDGAVIDDTISDCITRMIAAKKEISRMTEQQHSQPDYGVDIAGNRLSPLLDNGLTLSIVEQWSDWARYRVESKRMIDKRHRRNSLDLGLVVAVHSGLYKPSCNGGK